MNQVQVFLLHFAGGSSYSFNFLRPYFNELEFCPLELPGRGRRSKEPLLDNFQEAAEDMKQQVLKLLGGNSFVIYGHSLGAMLALEVTRKLEGINKAPLQLIVSGNPGPCENNIGEKHLLGKEELKDELMRIGGTPAEFFKHDELYDFYEPVIRSDFTVAARNMPEKFSVVRTPIYAVMGDREEGVCDIGNWKNFTHARFEAEILDGDHFFIFEHADRIAAIIRKSQYHTCA